MSEASAPEVVDAQVVPEEVESPRELVLHQPRRGEVLKPLDLAEQKKAMQTYQLGLRKILDASDWQSAGGNEKFVKKSGWRKIAAWFDLSIELIRDEVERDEDGRVSRACVWARAVAPSGRFADGDGYCEITEKRFNRESAKQKLENDLRGTATTRAVNRAISNLVGIGAVSAEEVNEPVQDPQHPFGPPHDKALNKIIGQACTKLADNDPLKGRALYELIRKDCGGYFPQAAAMTLIHCADTDNLVPHVEAPEPQ